MASGGKGRGAIAAIVLSAAILAGCGFEPLYGRGSPSGAVAPQLADVEIAPIPDRRGQILRNFLIDQFYARGRPVEPTHRLDVTLSVLRQSLGVARDATATRAQLVIAANYQLWDIRAEKPFFRASSRNLANFNIQTAPFANVVSEDEALEDGLRQLSEDITQRVAMALRREP